MGLIDFDDLILHDAFEKALQKFRQISATEDGPGAPKKARMLQTGPIEPYKESRQEFLSKVGHILGTTEAASLDDQVHSNVTLV